MIGVMNYGLGNVQAFLDAFLRLGEPAVAVAEPNQAFSCDRLVLPGVGSFDLAMQRLNASRLRPALEGAKRSGDVPILGVCVGLQILFASSEEGEERGLAWLPGHASRLAKTSDPRQRLPHIGWNSVECASDSGLFSGLKNASFYFLHSYAVVPSQATDTVAWATHGTRFAAAVCRNAISGVQFHPEKSHHAGLRLLQNFAAL